MHGLPFWDGTDDLGTGTLQDPDSPLSPLLSFRNIHPGLFSKVSMSTNGLACLGFTGSHVSDPLTGRWEWIHFPWD